MKKILIAVLLLLVCQSGYSIKEAPSVSRGLEIMREFDKRRSGFHDYEASYEMKLVSKSGAEKNRFFKFEILEGMKEGDKSKVVFEQPLDLKGFAVLTYSYKKEDDDQWIYLPEIKRVKRIATASKTGPFLGSEFAYEDIANQEIEKFSYKYLREEKLDGVNFFVVERTPNYSNSGYTKQLVWLDSEHYRIHRIDYYDRSGDKLKSLRKTNYKLYLSKIWLPGENEMVNIRNGKKTVMKNLNVRFHTGLNEKDFTVLSLKRVR